MEAEDLASSVLNDLTTPFEVWAMLLNGRDEFKLKYYTYIAIVIIYHPC